MKLASPFLLVLVAAGALTLAGFAARSWQTARAVTATGEAAERLARDMRTRFEARARPELRFSLRQLPQWDEDPALTDPAALSPEATLSCDPENYESEGAEAITSKVLLWGRFQCGLLESLPEDFFSSAPQLHPSGRSYVGLALRARPERFAQPGWLERHTRWMHIAELSEAAAIGAKLSPAEQVVAGLDRGSLEAVGQELEALVSGNRLLLRGEGDPARYAAYALRDWESFAANEPLVLVPRGSGETCRLRVGTLCWEPNTALVDRHLAQAAAYGGSALGLLLLALLWVALRRFIADARERGRRTFVLQTLAHEIRTPATSLQLNIEALRRGFDGMEPGAQSAFLRLCDDAGRLRRVIEASRQYLSAGSERPSFRSVELDDLEGFLAELLADHGGAVSLEVTAPSGPVRLDPYWFGVCVTNLVDNALRHGQAPARVRVAQRRGRLEVEVEDEGQGPPVRLSELASPFQGRGGSGGLGLGLAVVRRIVREMGGNLRYEREPTRFSFSVPASTPRRMGEAS